MRKRKGKGRRKSREREWQREADGKGEENLVEEGGKGERDEGSGGAGRSVSSSVEKGTDP